MAPSTKPPSRARRERRHQRGTSSSELLQTPDRDQDTPPRRKRTAPSAASNALSANALAQLNALNEASGWQQETLSREQVRVREEPRKKDKARERDRERRRDNHRDPERERSKVRDRERRHDYEREREHRVHKHDDRQSSRKDTRDHNHYRKKKRVVSGPLLEEGRNRDYNEKRQHKNYEYHSRERGSTSTEDDDSRARRKKRKKIWIFAAIVTLVIVIIIAVAVGVSKNKGSSSSSSAGGSSSNPPNTNLRGVSPSSIPASAQGTYYDPFTWYDTLDFNLTYTDATVGGLPIMGLNSTWDSNVQANPSVPALNSTWTYGGSQKIHGINIGGWLSIEPFITPSFFNQFSSSDGVIDEYTYTSKLGQTAAAQALEKHYSSFISEQDFVDMQAAGFDHVRISYSYWAVTTYSGDPYVPMISFRYLLRAIEWARKHGLRINLDLHGVPGSQNGWNHSGRQGVIGWLNGTDGALNAQRTIDIHTQLATFFSQPRYTNLVTLYGLVNEPKMIALNTASVVNWSTNAISAIRAAGLPTSVPIIIGDGFLGLANWQGSSLGDTNQVLLDAHQYVIFNTAQLVLSHTDKINFACQGWTQQSEQSMSSSTGFGNFLCGEWSQADTDCQTYLNNVGVGARWTGTLNTGNASTSVLKPTCAVSSSSQCDCAQAMADSGSYSAAYKQWLMMFAEAQMHSYEAGWGWFYWTWKTETATQWSYQLGMQAGILPTNVLQRSFDCSQTVPDFAGLGLSEGY